MPLKTRSISPVNISIGRLPPGVKEDELLWIANGSLANLVRQMSSLSLHASHMFADVHSQVHDFEKRIEKINERNLRLQDTIDQPDDSVPVSLEGDQMRKPYRSNNIFDQHTLDRSTLPPALAHLYDRCESPPKLHLLDQFREGPKLALKFYTDPQYFFDLWKEEMLKTTPTDKIPTTRTSASSTADSPSKRKNKARNSSGNRQQMPVQSNVVLSHYTTKMQQQNEFMHFPSEYQAPQFLRNTKHVDDSLPPPPGMSMPLGNQNRQMDSHKNSPNAEFSHNFQGLHLTHEQELGFDDDDDLPPPPPPLSDHSNFMHSMGSPSMSSTMTSTLPKFAPSLTLLEGAQNNPQSLPPPPPQIAMNMNSPASNIPPPPPPPPSNSLMTTSTIQSNAVPSFVTHQPTDDSKKAPPTTRSNLLQEIQIGIQLKKVQKEAEKEEKKKALNDNDVAAILQKRMEKIMGKDSDDDDDDTEWD